MLKLRVFDFQFESEKLSLSDSLICKRSSKDTNTFLVRSYRRELNSLNWCVIREIGFGETLKTLKLKKPRALNLNKLDSIKVGLAVIKRRHSSLDESD